MPAPVLIGDEVTAAGYRLAGARARPCAPRDAAEELERALAEAPVILLAATHALHVPPRRLAEVLAAEAPAVWIVPDARGLAEAPDVALEVREVLGVQP